MDNILAEVTAIVKSVAAVETSLTKFKDDVNVFYTLFCGAAVFFMQCGFAMLCAGSVRQKNVKNIMLKNLLDACGGALGYWSIGFAIAYGEGAFIGTSTERFFLNNYTESGGMYIEFFFQFAFAATAATIVAGTIAERCKMEAYLLYSIFLTAFVYPVIVHAVWNEKGFLCAWNSDPLGGTGMLDFAGSGVVHMTGGCTALVAAIILGPRLGRFYDAEGKPLAEPRDFPPHSVALQVLGTFILWFGWYGFNPGSTLFIADYGDTTGLCAVTTTLSAAAGCVSALFIDTLMGKASSGHAEYDLTMAMNGVLGGLVGITANCNCVAPWAAVLIGIISGVVYVFSSKLLVKLRIDDAVDAVPVHFFCGIWGCIATGLFCEPGRSEGVKGLFYGGGTLLGVEIAGILFIIGWTGVLMGIFFTILNALGIFRVDEMEEKVGLDISHHKGAAYDLSSADQADLDNLAEKRSTHGNAVA